MNKKFKKEIINNSFKKIKIQKKIGNYFLIHIYLLTNRINQLVNVFTIFSQNQTNFYWLIKF